MSNMHLRCIKQHTHQTALNDRFMMDATFMMIFFRCICDIKAHQYKCSHLNSNFISKALSTPQCGSEALHGKNKKIKTNK